jgi:predicted Zn-dependent protease
MRALARFNFDQEIEADREGLMLAWRAGWPASRLANYFKKLSRASHSANFDSDSHPAPARRWQAARALAQDLEKTK